MKNPMGVMSAEHWEVALRTGRIAVALATSVVTSYQGEQTVLLDYETGEYYGLNTVGTSVWKLLRDGRTFTEIVGAITAEYEVSPDLAGADVAHLLSDLHARGIVRVRE